MFSPSGIGVLYGKKKLLDKLSPFQKGGGTIFKVRKEKTDFANTPQKFEAGTPFIEGAISLSEVLKFLKKEVDFEEVRKKEKEMVLIARKELSAIKDIEFIGSKDNSSNILSFHIKGFNCSDLATLISKQKVALRAGHHCCMPFMEALNLKTGTVRASFSVYNQKKDSVALRKAVEKALEILK